MTAATVRLSTFGRRTFLLRLVAIAAGLLFLIGFLGPIVYPVDPWAMSAAPFLWPFQNASAPLGTDSLGRDVLAGLMHGTRLSLFIGIIAASTALIIGVIIGAIAGYYRGLVDDILMRLTDTLQTTPSFLLMIVIVAVLGSTIPVIIGAIVVVSWPPVARLARAEFLSLREREYVKAARLLGRSDAKIIFLEILPNALPPILVMISILVSNAILAEAAMSFLGLGDPNANSLGTMIGVGRESLRSAWYLVTLPGLVIVMIVLTVNLFGDFLNEWLNPRSKS